VLADRKGRRFYAIVSDRGRRQLQVEPIDRRATYHQVKAARFSRSGTSAGSETATPCFLTASDEKRRPQWQPRGGS